MTIKLSKKDQARLMSLYSREAVIIRGLRTFWADLTDFAKMAYNARQLLGRVTCPEVFDGKHSFSHGVCVRCGREAA